MAKARPDAEEFAKLGAAEILRRVSTMDKSQTWMSSSDKESDAGSMKSLGSGSMLGTREYMA
eukprot:gene17981-24387_t